MSVAAFIIILLPVFFYAFDSFFPVVPRYYITAVPLVTFGLVIFLNKSFPQSFLISRRHLKIAIVILAFGNLLSYVNTKDIEGFSFEKMKSVASFLDFPEVSSVLRKNFNRDSIVISNHALVTGLSDIHKVIFVPKYESFIVGNNKSIEGVVFTYTENPEAFSPGDWLSEGLPREIIQDKMGVKYALIYNQRNVTWSGYSSRCLIYKKVM